jgi:hypothetical protein
MANTTANSTAFIEAEQYSAFILSNLHDGMLPTSFWRNVSDFGKGTTLNIKTIGAATLQEAEEDQPLIYNPIDSGEVTLSITDHVGDAWYVTDELREDGNQVEALTSAHQAEETRAVQEHFESRFLQVCNQAQTDADANTINGFAHRIASSAAGNVLQLEDLSAMKLAFDKANVPYGGRVAVIDPVCAKTLDDLVTIQSDVTPFAEKILREGWDRDHEFLMNLYGWNIFTSNRLDTGDFGDGTTSVTGAVANVFMSVLDDQHRPIMAAWRRMPRVEGDRNKDRRRDEFVQTARWGQGPQRVDTLGIYATSASNS